MPVLDEAKPSLLPAERDSVRRSIFQQEWWLQCATDGQFEEITIKNGGQTVAWLPYAIRRRWGFSVSDMPLLTHTLGPVISPGTGSPNSRLLHKFSITRELLSKLPKLAHFRQILSPTHSEALAFQAYGCHVKVQYTFIAQCADIDGRWKAMRDKTRNLIRRSREKNVVSSGDPAEFLEFYDANCRVTKRNNRYQDQRTKKLLALCVERDQGRVILSRDEKTRQRNAAIFVVWDDFCMYFLMSTRLAETADSGAVSLLVWEAMNEAHRRGLNFDLDGVTSSGTFRFLSGFGGDIAHRLIVEKFDWTYHSMDKIRALTSGVAPDRPFD